ncbi:MAG: diacylglycerol kinase [Advenella sp.]
MNRPSHPHGRKNRGVLRFIQSTVYSAQGFRAAFSSEEAFRQELIVCIALTPFAFLLGRNFAEIIVLLGVLVSVLTVELINSAIEVLADTVSAETHPLIGQTKDIASAAVMMVITFAGLVWFGLLFVRLFSH